MIKNINYNGQFNLEVISKLNDKLDKLKKENSKCCECEGKFCNDCEIDNDRNAVLDIEFLGLIISDDFNKIDERFKITIAINLIERILESELYNIDDSEINKDYMVKLRRKLKERMTK